MEGNTASIPRTQSHEGNSRTTNNREPDFLSSADESETEEMFVRTTVRSPKFICGKYTIHHIVVFMLTFWSYALIHAMRKTFSNVKSTILATWTPQNLTDRTFKADYMIWNSHSVFHSPSQAESFLGILDALFMFCYAAGLFISGILGDRFDPRIVLSLGMCGTAIVNFIFGFILEIEHFYSVPLFVGLWIVNGFLQSTGWPANVCVMGDWFGRSSRGFVLGIWSGCASVGNIVGAYLAASVLPYGYEFPFLVASSVLFAGGVIVFFGLVSRPREIGLPEPEESSSEATKALLPTTTPEALSTNGKNDPISFSRAFMLPGVIAYSAAYASLKLVNYSIFFWLPYYLKRNFGWSEEVSGTVSSWYDWGGIIGVTLAGFLSDRLGKRTPIIMVQLLFGLVSLGVITASPDNEDIAGVLMGIAGFFVGGAANLVSGAVSADLGRQEALQGDARALSTVTGIVDGTGSVGAALGQVMIPVLQMWFGWGSVFDMFMVMIVVTGICLSKLCWKEVKELRGTWNRRYSRLRDGD